MQLTAIVVIDHVARNNQLVPIVHGDLHVIARNQLCGFRQERASGRCATTASRRFSEAPLDPPAFARLSEWVGSLSANLRRPLAGNDNSARRLHPAPHRRLRYRVPPPRAFRQPLAGDDSRLRGSHERRRRQSLQLPANRSISRAAERSHDWTPLGYYGFPCGSSRSCGSRRQAFSSHITSRLRHVSRSSRRDDVHDQIA